jgi:SAM-dependent methyltransferase
MDHHHDVDFESPALAARAQLEGEVLAPLATDAIAVLAGQAAKRELDVRRVLDLGCGPGVATVELARRFPTARLVAADGSAAMLARAAERATRSGAGDRIETRHVQLPDGLAALDPADVVWASMVLHHVGDETAALRRLRAVLTPGGLLALVERAGPVRVLPDRTDLGRPGLWDRLDAAGERWFAGMREALPGATPSADYASILAAAGWSVVADEVLTLDLDPPLDDRGRRFAHQHLEHLRARLDGHADPADLAALDELLAGGVEGRAELAVHAARHLYVAAA